MKNFILGIINNVNDETDNFEIEDIKSGKNMGILCYIVPFIPYFYNKNNTYVKYHSVIGMNLFLIALFYFLIYKMIIWIDIDIFLIKIVFLIIWLIILLLFCLGISNVCNGKAKELPIINKIKVFK